MSDTTTVTIPHAINNFYNRTMLKAARPLLPHLNWAQVKDIPKGETETIKFRRYELLSAATTPLTEGVTPSGSQLSYTDVYGSVSQYGDFVTLTDRLQFSTPDPVLAETADVQGQQAGNTLDQIGRDVMLAGSTIQYASTAVGRTSITSAMKITLDEVQQAVRTLKTNNAMKITRMVNPSNGFNTTPLNACYVAIVHPNTTFDLKKADGWVPVEEYPNQAGVMEGEVGKIDEVRFVESTNAKVYTAGGAGSIDIYGTLVLAANYYGITRISGEAMRNIIKPLGSAGTADPLEQRSTSGWKATFLCLRLNENYAVRIEHAVSA